MEKRSSWYRIQYSSGSKSSSGWISSASAGDFDPDAAEESYAQLVERNYQPQGMSFAVASEVFELITGMKTSSADLGLKRLLSLRQAIKAIPQSPNKQQRDFLKANENSLVYSDPAGEWMVRGELFWDLHKKFKEDAIAWEAAKNPIPGECEGYVNCYLFYTRQTDGEYLSLYPAGKNAVEAVKNIENMLEPIVQDLTEKTVYSGPADVTDRAEFNRIISELRSIISRLEFTEKEKPLQQLQKIAEAYR